MDYVPSPKMKVNKNGQMGLQYSPWRSPRSSKMTTEEDDQLHSPSSPEVKIEEDNEMDFSSAPWHDPLSPKVKTEENNDEPVDLLPCDLCFGKFSSDEMELHINSVHDDTTFPYRCPERIGNKCKKRYATEHGLGTHFRRYHQKSLGERKWMCPGRNCRRSFFFKRSLDEHVEEHDFKCEACGKEYHVRALYEGHLKVCKGSTDDYECEHCGRSFVRKYYWENHHCAKGLASVDSASSEPQPQTTLSTPGETASTIASGELLPHGCSDCSERFGNRAKLHKHLKDVHNREPLAWLTKSAP